MEKHPSRSTLTPHPVLPSPLFPWLHPGWHMSHWWTANQTRPIQFRTDLRPAEFNEDYGEPLCSCTQVSPGVFVRFWSKANVTVNCNTLEGDIEMLPT